MRRRAEADILRDQIRNQRAWIIRHGKTLEGYIAHHKRNFAYSSDVALVLYSSDMEVLSNLENRLKELEEKP